MNRILLMIFMALPLAVSAQTFNEEAAPYIQELDKLCVTYPEACADVDMDKVEMVKIKKRVCPDPLAGTRQQIEQALAAMPDLGTNYEALRQTLTQVLDDNKQP